MLGCLAFAIVAVACGGTSVPITVDLAPQLGPRILLTSFRVLDADGTSVVERNVASEEATIVLPSGTYVFEVTGRLPGDGSVPGEDPRATKAHSGVGVDDVPGPSNQVCRKAVTVSAAPLRVHLIVDPEGCQITVS